MALHLQASYSGGELDPALQERITLKKYDNGLATARNSIIGKTGRLLSRPGRKHLVATKLADRKVVTHVIPELNQFIEWGHQYVRWYEMDGTLLDDIAHTYTEDDLDAIRFVNTGDLTKYSLQGQYVVLIMQAGVTVQSLVLDTTGPTATIYNTTATSTFGHVVPPIYVGMAATGTGYAVDYAYTRVVDGIESSHLESLNVAQLPINVGEINTLTVKAKTTADPEIVSEIRVYRRPYLGGAYGYVGSSTYFFIVGADTRCAFKDYGQDADYSHSPPTQNADLLSTSTVLPFTVVKPQAALVYQQRVILAAEHQIFSSRTGYYYNFFRDYPYSDDSSLTFSAGSDSRPVILWMIESDGLIVFTTEGVFTSTGALTPSNVDLSKRGKWLIDPVVPPIEIPGGVLFIDSLTNTVRQLLWSDKVASYVAEELSIFSDHLFRDNKVTSWAFQDGPFPLLWVTFSDGTYASFTYEQEHQMRAWTRHDSGTGVEWVSSIRPAIDLETTPITRQAGRVIYVVNNDGTRAIETNIARYPTADEFVTNPEADKGETIAAMDSVVSWSHMILDDITDDDVTLTPVTPGDWEGDLTLACVDDAIFPDPGIGAVGTIFRHFHPVDRTEVDLEVTARTNDNEVTVTPSAEFPSAYATNPRLYETEADFSGLDHMDGENVSVISDGYVIASPNNSDQDYPTVTPAAGAITLPGGRRGAIVHIGRPYVMDIETLDMETVEQRPIHIESKTVNKIYVKTYQTRGLYIGNQFDPDGAVEGMENADSYVVNYEDTNPFIANRYDQPKSRRLEITLGGEWDSNGRVCIRQVDPLHFEILSIYTDVEDQRR